MTKKFALITAAATLAASALTASAATITQWDFQNVNTATATANTVPATTPTPTIGSGSASTLGMVNSYASSNTSDGSNVFETTSASDQGSSDPTTAASNNIWRVVGNNGWNSAAPEYSQGAQFNVSTVGYSNVKLAFDWYATKRGVDDLQVQYTTDGSTYNNIGSVLSFTTSSAGNSTWKNQNSIDFTNVAGVSNDPNFGIRLVAAYHGATASYVDTTGTALNNTSGNWRFDEVTFSGTAATAAPTPEPASLGLIGLGSLAMLRRRRQA